MSKKHRNRGQSPASFLSPSMSPDLADEYRIIRHDLVRVIIVNVLFLAGVLALYYTNAQSQWLERWIGQVLHF